MRTHTKLIARTVLLVAAGWFAGCNGTIDDEPNVVLEVKTVTITPITGTRNATTGTCVFTITNATASFDNKPKNALATASPFNDIVLQSVTVDYFWQNAQAGVASSTFGVGGTIPANGTGTAQFSVVNAQDLLLPVDREGQTASLTLTFRGTTVDGEAVSATTGGSLTVNTCP